MDSFIVEINDKLRGMLDDIESQKQDYSEKLEQITGEIENKLEEVKNYKEDFYNRKQTIERMQNDIAGFEHDYQQMVDKLKDTELANILVSVNKEVSSKIDERKRMINKDIDAMNELVDKAEGVKNVLVQLKAEKKALELCYSRITDMKDVYSKGFKDLIDYSENTDISTFESKIDNEDTEIDFNTNETIQETPVDDEVKVVEIDNNEEQPKTLDDINDELLGKTVQLDTINSEDMYTPPTLPDDEDIAPYTPDYNDDTQEMSVINLDELNAKLDGEENVEVTPEEKDDLVLPAFEKDEEDGSIGDIQLPTYDDEDETTGFSLDEIQLASNEYDQAENKTEDIVLNSTPEVSTDDEEDDSGFSLDEDAISSVAEIPYENDETTDLENLINFGE